MSRSHDISPFLFRTAAASAGTTTQWMPVLGEQAWLFVGWSWLYETTEANADNTLDFTLDYGTNTTFTALFANGNANGLLDSGAILTPLHNKGNAASGAGAAIAVTPTVARVAFDNLIRCVLVTAGTGTVPAIQMAVEGYYI